MSATLHIQLMGDFRLTYGDVLLSHANATRLKSLLAYLLLHRNSPQPRHHLAYLFWPDSNETQAHDNLRQSFHRLRQALPNVEDYLHSDAQTIQWLPDSPFTLDIAEFEGAVEHAGSVDSLENAANLYRGEFLPGCYDDWILIERERLQQKFQTILEQLIRSYEDHGNYRSAIIYAERMLRTDPLREETYQKLIHLHAISGNRTGAYRVYKTCVTVLKRELGVEPSSDTQAAYEVSQKVEIPSVRQIPSQRSRINNLPTYLTSFIGRKRELECLMQLFSSQDESRPQSRLITLTGAGGCGKTRLANELATQLLETFPDGVWFVDLAPLTNPMLIPQAIAVALDVQEQSGRALHETLSVYLRTKQLLLILDNCEHLVAECAQVVRSLLQTCPGLSVLATSSEKLNVMGEAAWPVKPLSLPDVNDPLSLASRSDAVHLFVERACSVLPTFTLNADNTASVVQICQHLDGIPLAVELAAARISMLTPAQIAARLNNVFQLLSHNGYTTRPHHQTLRATMDWSYDLLTQKEHLLFQRLSVFSGGFTLEAVETVCSDPQGSGGILTSDILDLLSRLIDKSLVIVSDWTQGDQLQYRLLQPTWQYAQEKLSQSDDWESFQLRHMEYFLNLAEMAEHHFTHVEQGVWFDRLLAEHDNLMAAIEWSLKQRELTTALRLTGTLWYYWLARGYYKEGLKYLRHALELTKSEVPTRARARALWAAGAIYLWSESDWWEARPLLEDALAASRALGDKQMIAGSLGTLGATAFGQGDYAAAYSYLTESLSIFPEVDDQHGFGWSLAYLGDLFHLQQDDEQARIFYEKSAERFRKIGDINSLAYPIRRLGVITLEWGDDELAITLFKDSLRMNREVNYPKGIAACLGALAGVMIKQGQLILAAKLLGAAEMLLNSITGRLFPLDQAEYDRMIATLMTQLDKEALDAIWAESQGMKIDEIVDYALKIETT